MSLILAALLSMLISATVSSFFRSTAVATTVAYGILISLFAGTLLVWVNLDAPFGHSLVESTLRLNPLAAALSAIEADVFNPEVLCPGAVDERHEDGEIGVTGLGRFESQDECID